MGNLATSSIFHFLPILACFYLFCKKNVIKISRGTGGGWVSLDGHIYTLLPHTVFVKFGDLPNITLCGMITISRSR